MDQNDEKIKLDWNTKEESEMVENTGGSSPEKMVGTTDCFEAVSTFRCMKNLLFWIAILSLLLLQGVFWIEHLDYVDKTGMDCPLTWGTYPPLWTEGESAGEDEPAAAKPALEGGQMKEEISDSAKTVVESIGETAAVETNEAPKAGADETPGGFVSWALVFYAVKFCNFAVMMSVTLYVGVILVCLQISIAGRLGGIAHISAAFFRAALAWVLLLPWQNFLRGVCGGVLFGPGELLCGPWGGSLMGEIVTLLRFCGFWLLAFVLLIMAQSRSGKWSHATLRRLGMN